MDLEILYERYGPMVLRRCRQLLADEDDALDAMQDVFVRVARRRMNDLEFPSSFLYTVATNICLNRIRDRSRRGETAEEGLVERIAAIDETEAQIGARSTLARLFGASPASSRTIAMLHYVDGMTLEETAREVGMSVSGVRKRLRALRAALKDMDPQ